MYSCTHMYTQITVHMRDDIAVEYQQQVKSLNCSVLMVYKISTTYTLTTIQVLMD